MPRTDMAARDAYNKKYYAENRERIKAQTAAYYEANREEMKQKKREYGAKNRAKCSASNLAWRRANREKARQHDQASHARHRASGTFNRYIWQAMCDFLEGACWDCLEVKPLTVGHLKPVSLGGSNHPTNIMPQCMECNNHQGNTPHRLIQKAA